MNSVMNPDSRLVSQNQLLVRQRCLYSLASELLLGSTTQVCHFVCVWYNFLILQSMNATSMET